MKLLTVLVLLFLSNSVNAQTDKYPSILEGLPTIPWLGLQENPMITRSGTIKIELEYLWTFEKCFTTSSGETKYRVLEKFKKIEGQKDSESMVNDLFAHLILYTSCSKVNENLYSLNIGGFIKKVDSNKGLVFLIIAKSDVFEDKSEYSELVTSTFLTF